MQLQSLQKRKLINPPLWLSDNTHYMTIMGSHAYGVADTHISSNLPDYDYYGFCIPPKELVFPHQVGGEIDGFGSKRPRFTQFLAEHVVDSDAKKQYDIQIHSIVKYFELCRNSNPNMIDSLFTPLECMTHVTDIGHMVRNGRKLFLSKLAYHRFRGYAFSQISKAQNVQEADDVKEIRKFEEDIGIDHTTRYQDLLEELKSRGLS